MINDIIKGIVSAIRKEFGEGYMIYTEEVRQGLKEPCFFILALNPEYGLYRGHRYFGRNGFVIQFMPPEAENTKNKECHEAAGRIFECLEVIEVSGDKMRGTNMNYEINEGVMSFFVNYDVFTRKTEETESMEELKERMGAM